MKILVAGGAGYLGSVLVPAFLKKGFSVDVVDLLWFGNHLPPSVSVLKKDTFSLTEKDLEGYDQVIFLAGVSNDPMAEFAPGYNFIQNGAGPAYFGYIARKAGVRRFIYASSCSVYGYTVNELNDEDSPAISKYPYGISKLQGEVSVLKMQDDNFSVICLRQGTICGFSPRMRLDLVINTMFKTTIENKEIIVNNPAVWRPILSIHDAVSAYLRASECDYNISGVFNIASDNYTVGEIAEKVRQSAESCVDGAIKLTINSQQDYRNYKVCIQKASDVLNFKPEFDVSDIMQDLIANLDKFNDFNNPNYYNIKVFKTLSDINL